MSGILLLMLFSCMQEEGMEEISAVQDGRITLRFSLPQSQSRVAGATEEEGTGSLNENRIKSLDVFIYQAGGDDCLFYQHIVPAPELTDAVEYSKDLTVTQERFSLNMPHDIYVVANYSETIPAEGLSLTALKTMAVSALDADRLQESFFMDGVRTMVLNDGLIVNKEIAVTLKRAAAKIRVTPRMTNGYSLADDAFISKKLVNYASAGSLIADGNLTDPALKEMTGFTEQNSGAGNNNQMIVYSYANDWNKEVSKETYLLINVPLKDAQGAVYMQNYYKVPVNYRLDASGTDNPSLYRLERNNLYDITVMIDKQGATTPEAAVALNANYIIRDWTTKQILVEVEGVHFIYVQDTKITLPNNTDFTTVFQSSSPDVTIGNITVNEAAIANGSQGVNITWTPNAKSGNIHIHSSLPVNFVAKEITFTVSNGAGRTQEVSVSQYPALYIGSDISADAPGGSQGQNNKKMYVMSSFVADFSTLQNPDEFDEDFGSGYTHYAPDPDLGASYATYIRDNAVLGYPLTDSEGATIDTDENNRRMSPLLMLASQHGVTAAGSYSDSRQKCIDYVERDATTGETYSDWRMPTQAEIYMIDVLQNTRVCEVKGILEGNYYWSARATSAVLFMDPRVGSGTAFGPQHASVRCVRDVRR